MADKKYGKQAKKVIKEFFLWLLTSIFQWIKELLIYFIDLIKSNEHEFRLGFYILIATLLAAGIYQLVNSVQISSQKLSILNYTIDIAFIATAIIIVIVAFKPVASILGLQSAFEYIKEVLWNFFNRND